MSQTARRQKMNNNSYPLKRKKKVTIKHNLLTKSTQINTNTNVNINTKINFFRQYLNAVSDLKFTVGGNEFQTLTIC